jgi:hypothetical protein
MGTPVLYLDGQLVDTSNLVLFDAGGQGQTTYMYPYMSPVYIHTKHVVVKFGELIVGITQTRHEEGPYDRWPAPKDEDTRQQQSASGGVFDHLPVRWGESRNDRLCLQLTEFSGEEDGYVEDENTQQQFYAHVNRDAVYMHGTSHYSVPDRAWLGMSIYTRLKKKPMHLVE